MADIDAWPGNATQSRYLVRAFTEWAVARRLASGITVPPIPHTEPADFPGEDARWQLLRRCLDDTSMPLRPCRRSAPAPLRPVHHPHHRKPRQPAARTRQGQIRQTRLTQPQRDTGHPTNSARFE
jgi:hypothetical protein